MNLTQDRHRKSKRSKIKLFINSRGKYPYANFIADTAFYFVLFIATGYFQCKAPMTRYLGPLTSTVEVPGRRALRSAGTNRLVVPPVRLATVGSRAFPVAAAHTWNTLPEHIVSASTLQSFKRHLKTFLLQHSFRLAL